MFGKNQRIYELENQVERLQSDLRFSSTAEKAYCEKLLDTLTKNSKLKQQVEYFQPLCADLIKENKELKFRLESEMLINSHMQACVINALTLAPPSIEIHIDDVLIPTETAGDVTLEELAKLVVDGKPIERMVSTPIKIGMYKEEKPNV